ncbi:hypothetical protein [Sulfurovum mangrovi]|uniref:hypothetical protein n=1 Tax=Sulfurovum mangrovi TaxID=2893889 RepID=UPI001E2980B1|nr:hypothetical protein [Sulfurovum mangrovi]UFH58042.1 hypothetical protein LN246_06715 [Sulfurovum mangrovi]
MQLKNDESSSFELIECIEQYYKKQNRLCSFIIRTVNKDNYTVDFLIDRKQIIRYSIPLDTRNCFAMVFLGIGPCFVSPHTLFGFNEGERFSKNSTTEAVEQNLKLLDQYLDLFHIS